MAIFVAFSALILCSWAIKSLSVLCVTTMLACARITRLLGFWLLLFPYVHGCPCCGFGLNCFFAGWFCEWCESLFQPFLFCPLACCLACLWTWLTPSVLGSLPVMLVPLIYFAVARPASNFFSFCLIVAAVTSGDSSLMIFD